MPAGESSLHRTRIACKSCNARRVKCDAGLGQPCWHCRIRETSCELIDSKRGKYPRQRPRKTSQKDTPSNSQKNPKSTSPTSAQVEVAQDTLHPAVDDDRSWQVHQVFPKENAKAPEDREARARLGTPVTEPAAAQQDNGSQTPSEPRSFYLGDSTELSYILEMICYSKDGSTGPVKVHYSIPACLAARAQSTTGSVAGIYVTLNEALVMPAKEISDRLLRCFFELFFPAFPVIDRKSFIRQYQLGRASPLLLHAMYLVAFTIGDEELAQKAGYLDRTAARKAHYLRTKALYDLDYEKDQTTVTMALVLLSFWWAGPEDQKDSWYWQGCATTLAQSMGMHRCTKKSEMRKERRMLWKRIWWSIYLRDRCIAASLGRPFRIQDEDCDIRCPTEEDLSYDEPDAENDLIPKLEEYHIQYFLELIKLSTIMGDVIKAEFSPRRDAIEKYDKKVLLKRIQDWESQQPSIFRCVSPTDSSLNAPFWASMLKISQQNMLIYIHRPTLINNPHAIDGEGCTQARIAADTITRTAEDLLAVGTLKNAQIHLVPAIFGALSIYTVIICRKDAVPRQLAENKARQCILALSELSKTLPVDLWMFKFFMLLMQRLTGQSSATGNLNDNATNKPFWDSPGHREGTRAIERDGQAAEQVSIMSECPSLEASGSVTETHPTPGLAPLVDEWQGSEFSRTADQLVHDSFWLGYMDQTYDGSFSNWLDATPWMSSDSKI